MIKEKIGQLADKRNMSPYEYIQFMKGIELAIDNFNYKYEDIETRFRNNTISETEFYNSRTEIFDEILSYSDATKEYFKLINSIKDYDKSITDKPHVKIKQFTSIVSEIKE